MKLSTHTSAEFTTHFASVIFSVPLGKATTVHRLILLDFLQSSMNSLHVLHAIQKGLMSRRLIHDDVFSVSADGCSVNLRAHAAIERDMGVAWFLNLVGKRPAGSRPFPNKILLRSDNYGTRGCLSKFTINGTIYRWRSKVRLIDPFSVSSSLLLLP